jgi:predicted nucleic acid-binding Zn ribbon protein
MSDPPPDACEVCGHGPLEVVLYPVAVHFKGSGFYTTDYGRGAQKKDGPSKDGAGESSSKPEKTDKTEKVEKKAAETA